MGSTGTASLPITNDLSTDSDNHYVVLSTTDSGNLSSVVVSNTKLYFNPSTGSLNVTNVNSLSDVTFKTNIKEIFNATEIVEKIKGVSFDWKDTGGKSYGVIAQEIQKIIPEVVNDSKIKTVNYNAIIPFLINAIKELSERIKNLENIK